MLSFFVVFFFIWTQVTLGKGNKETMGKTTIQFTFLAYANNAGDKSLLEETIVFCLLFNFVFVSGMHWQKPGVSCWENILLEQPVLSLEDKVLLTCTNMLTVKLNVVSSESELRKKAD